MKKYTIIITIVIATILAICYVTIYKLKKPEQVSDQSIMALQDKAYDLAKEGKLKEAENVYLKAISHAKQLYGEKHCLAASPAYLGLFSLYIKQGKYDDAVTQLKAAIVSYENSVANVVLPINLLKLKILLANGYKYKQDYKNAEKHYLSVSPHVEKLPLNVQYDYYLKYGDVCSWLGQHKKALLLLNQALLLVKTHDSIKGNASINYIYSLLGNTYLKLRKDDKALSIFKKSIDIAVEKYGKDSEEAATGYFWLARAYLIMSKFKQSKQLFHKSIAISESCQSKLSTVVMAYINLANIAEIYDKDKTLALKFLQKAQAANSHITWPIEEHQQPIKANIKRIRLELQASEAKATKKTILHK